MKQHLKEDLGGIIMILLIITAIAFSVIVALSSLNHKDQLEQSIKLQEVEDRPGLYYDEDTQVVYLFYEIKCGSSSRMGISPYIARNGLPYVYENGELKMIIE